MDAGPGRGILSVDDGLDPERAAQALAAAIGGGGRVAWALVIETPEGERLFTCETPERARALLRRAAERRRA